MIRLGSLIYHAQQAVAARWQRGAIRRAMRRAEPADLIFVFGLSRSGSTWLQETIGAWPGTVSLFEPIHKKIPESAGAYTLEDWRPAGEAMSEAERGVVEALLRGEILSRRVLYGGPVGAPAARVPAAGEIRRFCIKLIHCNNGMPRMIGGVGPLRYRPLVILRHPCAHVASWKRLNWVENFGGLLGRYNVLLSRHPALREVAAGLSTPLECMAGNWCLGNWVPLTEESAGRWMVVRYEELQVEPERVLGEIFAGWGEAGGVPAEVLGAVGKASRTTWRKGQPAGTAVATADSWRGEVSEEECRTVFEVCRRFGVEVGYGGYRWVGWGSAEC